MTQVKRRSPHRFLLLLAVVISSVGLLGATCKRKMKKMDEYHRELWTAEADESLDRLNTALMELWKSSKNKAEFQFPSAGPTPAKVPCGSKPHKADSDLWDTPGWKKLGFSMTKPFRYQYRVISSGKGSKARFTIRAYGDLDCDGDWATYEMWGAINEKGKIHNCDGKKFDEKKAAE